MMPKQEGKMNKPQSVKQDQKSTKETQNNTAQKDGFRYDYNDSSDFMND